MRTLLSWAKSRKWTSAGPAGGQRRHRLRLLADPGDARRAGRGRRCCRAPGRIGRGRYPGPRVTPRLRSTVRARLALVPLLLLLVCAAARPLPGLRGDRPALRADRRAGPAAPAPARSRSAPAATALLRARRRSPDRPRPRSAPAAARSPSSPSPRRGRAAGAVRARAAASPRDRAKERANELERPACRGGVARRRRRRRACSIVLRDDGRATASSDADGKRDAGKGRATDRS